MWAMENDRSPPKKAASAPSKPQPSAVARLGSREGAQSSKRIPLLLVDGMTMIRESLAHVLKITARELTIECVGRSSDACAHTPRVVLLNVKSSRVGDEWVLGEIATLRHRFGATTPLIILSDRDDSDDALEAIRLGLHAYIPASLDIGIVVAAIRLVLAGGTFVPCRVIHQTVRHHAERTSADAPPISGDAVSVLAGLTRRETEVLALLRHGKANKVIAYELNISEATTKIHVRNIMKKLRARNRTQIVYFANAKLAEAI